nr:heavy metal translocating P-type ATPase [bacterium]
MKRTYHVTGMSCAACSARVERAVGKVPGVISCAVSLLTKSMQVEGEAESSAIIAAVEAAGYGAAMTGGEASGTQASPAADLARDEEDEREISTLKCRLGASLLFLGILLYFSMGHMLWNWPLPRWFDGNHPAMGLVQLLLSGIVLIINQKFFISGARALLHRAPNMDTLVALGAGAAFGYSTCALFAMTCAQARGGTAAAADFMNEFHFESAAMIVTLITVGKLLEARAKGKTTSALKSLAKLAPTMATLWRDGEERRVPSTQVKVGDLFVVRPGEQFPVDGVVLEGTSAVNEAALTGESVPVDKRAGDNVSAATINQSGFLRCQATRVGEDTALARIIRMVADAAADKAPIAKVADRVSSVFVPAIILIALITIAVWLFLGESAGFALARGIAVLVISCPCA